MSSKFKNLLDAARGREPEPEPEPEPQPEPPKPKGRPRGKRSNPDYEQVTAYIRRDTHRTVKMALLTEGGNREFSELVEELLNEWLSTQKSKKPKT